MRLIHGNDDTVAAFVASRIPFCAARGFGPNRAIGVARGDQVVGGFVFHDYAPEFGVIEMSFASADRRWLTRPVLYHVFSYVFDGIGCQMACSRTPASHLSALRITRAYGFRQVTVPRLFGCREDGVISTLTAEDWKSNGFHRSRSLQATSA
ncbi:N-acetyltransferase [Taklimakanibacter lacteus]|uniref:N-acetyltransferase n=1 Tax=Taklimakanibacter lacteus TaxID=2268456 RepID=UPI0013C4368E